MYRLLIVDDPESCAALQSRIDWQLYGFSVVMTANSQVEGINLALDLQLKKVTARKFRKSGNNYYKCYSRNWCSGAY